jgi:mannose-6-phosphate isomerase
MNIEDRLFTFTENKHEALWGFEEWLVSVHPSSPGEINSGKHKGRFLSELYGTFPLLVKEIDAKTRLSVQVHPNEKTCIVAGGSPKTEAWCMLEDGFVYAGFKDGVTIADIEKAVNDGSFESLLLRHDLSAGDMIYIPGGLVHAIGDGCKIYEVQQSSDTTFRLYDWNRVSSDGTRRELHLKEAFASIDLSLPQPVKTNAVSCPFFKMEKVHINGRSHIGEGAFVVIRSLKGGFSIGEKKFVEGETVFVSPGSAFCVDADNAEIIVTEARG